ncbi:nucleotidyltransferase family protein [Achromobacter xylosoxidans]
MLMEQRQRRILQTMLVDDVGRMRALKAVHGLGLPDCWIGAGFVRNLVWDRLAGFATTTVLNDVDVVWYGQEPACEADDLQLEQRLTRIAPDFPWSVKNQARMHLRNGDAPYHSTRDALTRWPETATAVAARLNDRGGVEILAPHGLDDLFAGIVRPVSRFVEEKRAELEARWRAKGWQRQWPFLRFE